MQKKKRAKTKSFNTNNQKGRKKTQAQTIKRTLIFWAPITFSQGD